MSHSSSFGCKTEKARNCHNLLMSSGVRRDMMADRLDSEWQELRRHASIERIRRCCCGLRLSSASAEWTSRARASAVDSKSCLPARKLK